MIPRPLRWYELALIRLLVKSPRIDRILIYQYVGNEPQAEMRAIIGQLEALYRRPGDQQ
jgi:hypothetical protein